MHGSLYYRAGMGGGVQTEKGEKLLDPFVVLKKKIPPGQCGSVVEHGPINQKGHWGSIAGWDTCRVEG